MSAAAKTDKPELPATVRREIERIEKRRDALKERWTKEVTRARVRFGPQIDAYEAMLERLRSG